MIGQTKIKVLSAGAVKDGVAKLAAEFEQASGHSVRVDFLPAPELRDRVAAGETADVVILPQSMMDEAAAQGKVLAASRALLGRSRMGVAVHAGAAPTGLDDVGAFTQLALGASDVVHNTASSGVYAGKLLEKLGIASKLGSRIVVVKSGAAVMEYVAAHPQAVGLAQISEIMGLVAKGCAVRLAGPLPDEIQNSTTYFAAVGAQDAAQPAGALLDHLTTPAAKATFAASGID